MEQTNTAEQTTATATEAAASPAPEAQAAPVATATEGSAPAITDEGTGVSIGGPEDAYLKAVKERLSKKGETEAKPSDEGEPKPAEAKPAEGEAPKGETRDEHRGKWWKSKSPEEKASITAKQTREELKAARDEIKALKAQIEELKPKPGKKGELTRADFETDRDWQRHLVDERLLELSEEKAAAEKEEAEVAARDKARTDKWGEAMARAFPDPEERQAAADLFHEKIDKMPISKSVFEYVLESGQPRLLLHIVRHPGSWELLKPGTSELLVGKRLTQIERYLEKQQASQLADTSKPSAQTAQASHEPLLKAATGSANNIGSAGVKANSREAQARDLQARILGLRV